VVSVPVVSLDATVWNAKRMTKLQDLDIPDEELTIQPLKIPDFKPHVSADDLIDFSKRDQRLLLAVSLIAQKVDFLIGEAQKDNEHKRRFEREIIKTRMWRRRVFARWGLLAAAATFLATTFASGLIGRIAVLLLQHASGTKSP